MKCPACKKQLYRAEVEKNLFVCNKCDHHMRISARERLKQFLDQESQSELFPNIVSVDPLNFKDTKKYKDRLNEYRKKTKRNDAFILGKTILANNTIILGVMNFDFMGGSMGRSVGDDILKGAKESIKDLSIIIYTFSILIKVGFCITNLF